MSLIQGVYSTVHIIYCNDIGTASDKIGGFIQVLICATYVK